MPRRSFTILALRAHKRGRSRKDPANDLDLDQLPGGRDLLTMFEACCREVIDKPDLMDDEKTHVSTGIADVTVRGRRLFIDSSIGEYSDGLDLRHRVSGEITYARQEDDVAPIASRAVLMVPIAGKVALYFAEVSGHSSAGARILKRFETYFRETLGEELTLWTEYVQEDAAWLEAANLTAVKAVVYGWSPNTEDAPVPKDGGTLTATLKSPAGSLPRKLLERLKVVGDRALLLGLPEEPDDVLVTLEGGGRRKEFDISRFQTPRLLIPLTAAGVPALDEAPLMERALDEAKDIFPRVGVTWNTGWNEDPAS